MQLYSALAGERLSIELVQLYQMESKILARFHANLSDIIFGDPLTIKEVRTEYLSLILHTTHHFPVLGYYFFVRKKHVITFKNLLGAC